MHMVVALALPTNAMKTMGTMLLQGLSSMCWTACWAAWPHENS